MRSLSVRLLLSFLTFFLVPAAFAHDVTLTGTNSFASLDGSASDHDGTANGVFTVSDGNLVVNGVVNCNDDVTTSACAMSFNVSGNLSVNTGGALYAENRSGSGTGGAITLTVGGNLALNGNAIVSTASKSSSGSTGGAITANVSGSVALASGTTIDSGSANAAGGAISIASGGGVTVDGNVLSGPSRTLLSTRLSGGPALDGGTSNTVGGAISIFSSTYAEPAVSVGATANIVSQGADGGAGPVTIEGCGVQVRGLVAALSKKDGVAKVSIRSGKDVLIDGRDLGGSGTRMGRIRADAPTGTAANKGVDIFATETIDVFGPSGSLFVITSLPGLHDSKSYGGLIRVTSLGDAVNMSGNAIDDGHTASGDSGGTVQIAAKEDVNLNTAVIRAHGDFNTNNNNRGGGKITARSHSGDVIWTNGTGDVRPVGSTSNLPLADQGSIVLTACGTVNTTGSSFPVNGTATSVFPETHTGVCSPAAPSLPSGVAALIVCNTPPVANDASVSTNEDTTVTITLSGSDADGDPLTFSIVSGPSNGTLGPIVPTGPTTATVDYSPNLNFNGSDSFVFQANDGNGGTDNGTVTITVVAVNDSPTFLAGPTVIVLEDSGAQTYPNWATSISPGPANEAGQTVTFTVTNDNPSLFSVQPAVSSTGTLTFTPAANTSGTANLTVTAQDNGGTANGGNDTSAPQSSAITVTPVNDEPSFTAGGDVTVNEDSGAYSAAWATAISAGPNEAGQTLTFFTSNDNNGLFSVQPSISSTGVLTFTPAANATGSATVTVYLMDNGGTANGGDDTSPSVTFTITVNGVNDEPSFVSGGDVSVLEDSGAYSATWATSISAGTNDPPQTLTFVTSNDNNGLFSVQPAIAADGTLTFTPAPNAFGSALVTVYLTDDGGTANGGDDTSPSVTFTINVNGVNDEPSFTAGGDVTVNEDSGAYSAPWASAISAGPNESGQTLTFVTSNDNNGLFSVQPSISSTGVLSFTPAPNAFGSATVSVYLMDNGGTANGGDDTSPTVTFQITVSPVNDPPTAVADSWETEGNTELRVDLLAGVTPHVADTTPSGKGVADNDFDGEGDPVTISGIVGCADVTAPYVCAVTGGTVTLNANGSFSFQPSPGATSGSFQYTVTDGSASANGTVSITIHDMIWYVNGSAAPGGNGTSASPFAGFGTLNGAGGLGDVDGAGDYIFVHTSSVSGSLGLESSQKLWGQGVGLIIPRNLNGNGSPTILVAAGAAPTVTATFGDVVRIENVTNTEVAGLSLVTTTGNGIDVYSSGAGAASASIYSNSVNAGVKGIDVKADGTGGTTVNVDNTSVLAMSNGVAFAANAGTVAFSYTDGSVTSLSANGILFEAANSAAVTTVDVSGTTFSSNPSQGLVIQGAGSSTISMATVSANTFLNNGLGINVTQADSANVTFRILNNTNMTGSLLHGINVFSSATSTGGTLTGRIQGNVIGDSGIAGSGSAFGNGIRVVVQSQTRGVILIDGNTVRQTPFGRGIEVTGQSAPGLDVTITNNDVDPQDISGFPLAAIFVTSDNLGSGGLVRADIRNNTVPAASNTYDYPNFDGTSANLVFEELSGATSELVDTPPASASASAQLASTNIGSTYANAGVSLIAGPILTPP